MCKASSRFDLVSSGADSNPANMEECAEHCDTTIGCTAFMFKSSTRRCQIKVDEEGRTFETWSGWDCYHLTHSNTDTASNVTKYKRIEEATEDIADVKELDFAELMNEMSSGMREQEVVDLTPSQLDRLDASQDFNDP